MTLLKWMCVILIGAGTYLMIDQKESSTTTHHKSWLIYALLSAVFASLTSLLGKVGMQRVSHFMCNRKDVVRGFLIVQ